MVGSVGKMKMKERQTMTKTDMMIKYMGIIAYLDTMEQHLQDKIKSCDFLIYDYNIELHKFHRRKKKKLYIQEEVIRETLNSYLDIKRECETSLTAIKTMAQELIKILEENKDKEEIPDEIFDGLFELFNTIQNKPNGGNE